MAFYPSPEDKLWERERVQKLLGLLTERQREVIVLRWGLGDEPELTYKEVGDRLGISHTRAIQLEARALEVMEDRVDFIDSGLTPEQYESRLLLGRYWKQLPESETKWVDQRKKRPVTDEQRRVIDRALKRARAKTSDPLILGLHRVLFIANVIAEELDVSREIALKLWRDAG